MNPNPNCKLTDFDVQQLKDVGETLNTCLSTGFVVPKKKENVRLFLVQVMNAISSVQAEEKVNQN